MAEREPGRRAAEGDEDERVEDLPEEEQEAHAGDSLARIPRQGLSRRPESRETGESWVDDPVDPGTEKRRFGGSAAGFVRRTEETRAVLTFRPFEA